jgi:hypothetical protein
MKSKKNAGKSTIKSNPHQTTHLQPEGAKIPTPPPGQAKHHHATGAWEPKGGRK